jgi:hypothetical protein
MEFLLGDTVEAAYGEPRRGVVVAVYERSIIVRWRGTIHESACEPKILNRLEPDIIGLLGRAKDYSSFDELRQKSA